MKITLTNTGIIVLIAMFLLLIASPAMMLTAIITILAIVYLIILPANIDGSIYDILSKFGIIVDNSKPKYQSSDVYINIGRKQWKIIQQSKSAKTIREEDS